MNAWKAAAAATIAVAALGTTGAVAQLLNDSEVIKTQQVTPADPAQVAPADPATTPSGQGSSAGESGYSSPAGIPADPTTNENQQPGMSPQNPTDPATGDKPDARVPSSTPGTGTSAP